MLLAFAWVPAYFVRKTIKQRYLQDKIVLTRIQRKENRLALMVLACIALCLGTVPILAIIGPDVTTEYAKLPTHLTQPADGPATPTATTVPIAARDDRPAILPTPTPTPRPTETSPTTPPQSAFCAAWAESIWENQGGTLWLADPARLSQAQAIFHIDSGEITAATISPDNQKAAVTTRDWKSPKRLWIMSLDGGDPVQIEQARGTGSTAWSPDSSMLAYTVNQPGNDSNKPASERLKLWSVADGAVQVVVEAVDAGLNVLRWSPDGRLIYYRTATSTREMQLWAVAANVGDPQHMGKVTAPTFEPLLSPDGSRFLLSDPAAALITADGGSLPGYRILDTLSREIWALDLELARYQLVWSNSSSELVLPRFDLDPTGVVVQLYDLEEQSFSEIGRFVRSPESHSLRLLSVSPDLAWAAIFDSTGFYFMHLPSGEKFPIPNSNRRIQFVAWISNCHP